MNGRWWLHPGLWMAAGALAYPIGTVVALGIHRWYSGADRGYAFGG